MKPAATTLQPPEPLTEHERSLTLVKAQPPEPTWAYYLLAAGTSLGGLIMGWIYLTKDGGTNKTFGLRAILLGLLLPTAIVAAVLVNRALQTSTPAPTNQPGVLLPE
ncbi:MAG: hypothetical protein U0514_02695 [Candidatus Andersenbacteria bacterium]